jgi:DNA-binding IclR family transcriptional regulator
VPAAAAARPVEAETILLTSGAIEDRMHIETYDSGAEQGGFETSLARALRVLIAVADHGTIRADNLSTLLDMPLSTVYRYLRTFSDFGFIDGHEGAYQLGRLVAVLPGSSVRSESLIRHSDPLLRSIVARTGETALLLTRVGLSALCLHQIESPRRMRMAFEPGELLPLHAGAGMTVLLAYAPPDIITSVVGSGLEQFTRDTPNEKTLRRRLPQIREQGWAVSYGQFIPGAVAVAAPVFCHGTVVAALDVAGPDSRCDKNWQAATRKLLTASAKTLGRLLDEEVAASPKMSAAAQESGRRPDPSR